MVGTWHILTQVAWFNKLKSEFGCFKVEMEYNYRFKVGNRDKFKQFRIDVYGENENNVFLVEIGTINKEKLRFLKPYSEFEGRIRFIYIPYPNGA